MKLIYLIGIIGCLCFYVPANAQLVKGTKYVAGTISLDGINNRPKNENPGAENFNQISVLPSVQFGKLVKDNVMAGIGVGSFLYFSWTKNKSNGTYPSFKESRQTYSLSPFLRHYKSLSPKWAIFLNSSVNLSYLHSKTESNFETASTDGFAGGVQVVPGISYWITPRFAVESDINLFSLSAGYQSFQNTNSFYFNSAVTGNLNSYLSVRASWYLHKP